MSIEQDLRDALRRQPAPPDLADRVMARIAAGDADPGASPAAGRASATVVPMTARGQDVTARIFRRMPWLAAAAAAAIVAVAGAQYSAYRTTAAEAERVQREIAMALQITSQTLALVQEKVERTTRDAR